ncbi:STAS domain-containing protein [Maritalea mobilis]|uniref:STAS domain-containing protein n=1 Tax=Maritalea mobilis TaxID=483324 RepID=UPI001C988391|nr:STAS domain-containing protein [Maritalea mobilis]MBY6202986.1 STAS domain-containing protein [Maritalea mobilis]
MNLSFETRQGVGIVHVEHPRIDASVAIRFKDRFREVTRDAPGDVILDLDQVEFIDSSGLGAVVAARKLLPAGRGLELAALQPAVDRVMQLTRMNTVFPIHDTLDAAVRQRDRASD